MGVGKVFDRNPNLAKAIVGVKNPNLLGRALKGEAQKRDFAANYEDSGMVDAKGGKIYKKKASLASNTEVDRSELSRATGRSSTLLGG